jgi:hypothetical protein
MSKTQENWLPERFLQFGPCAGADFNAFALGSDPLTAG